ncbi:MAG TPA: deoxyribose-phosphate aldolase [Saprospiraceae bacterium]|nr:deoxyribose-phosphate aldolase [Saprospiraceae bacterium]HMQ82027.1 deoxyribose-phosphate aldolase [Saprospiraceae bacterium]
MDLSSYIDHTLLKANSTLEDIQKCCAEAVQYGFAAVCVPPYYVMEANKLLHKKPPKVATVIGFPMGYSATPAKVEEIKKAIDEGADELDAVINLCAVQSANWNYLANDINSMITAAHLKGKVIKIILETGLLSESDLLQLCEIVQQSKPDFVKTSTGFNGEGATEEIIRLLRANLDPSIKIKASGGIRTKEAAYKMLEAGANRIGTSSGITIVS